MTIGGNQVGEMGPNDDGFDEEGYDESQRAEILEVTRMGPTNGDLLTDIAPDLGETDDDADEDELTMLDGEIGEEDASVDMAEEDLDEDDLQDDFDEDELTDEDGEEMLGDEDRDALEP